MYEEDVRQLIQTFYKENAPEKVIITFQPMVNHVIKQGLEKLNSMLRLKYGIGLDVLIYKWPENNFNLVSSKFENNQYSEATFNLDLLGPEARITFKNKQRRIEQMRISIRSTIEGLLLKANTLSMILQYNYETFIFPMSYARFSLGSLGMACSIMNRLRSLVLLNMTPSRQDYLVWKRALDTTATTRQLKQVRLEFNNEYVDWLGNDDSRDLYKLIAHFAPAFVCVLAIDSTDPRIYNSREEFYDIYRLLLYKGKLQHILNNDSILFAKKESIVENVTNIQDVNELKLVYAQLCRMSNPSEFVYHYSKRFNNNEELHPWYRFLLDSIVKNI